MPVVVDASMALAWVLHESHRPLADATIAEGVASGLAAPELFWIEVANVLAQQVRRNKLSRSDREGALADLQSLQVARHLSADRLAEIVVLSDRHDLTTYDAAYLELALRLEAVLATLDGDLASAARGEGLEVRSP